MPLRRSAELVSTWSPMVMVARTYWRFCFLRVANWSGAMAIFIFGMALLAKNSDASSVFFFFPSAARRGVPSRTTRNQRQAFMRDILTIGPRVRQQSFRLEFPRKIRRLIGIYV